MSFYRVLQADCAEWLRKQPDDSVDLVFTSPPYEDARTYGIGFSLKGQDWVDWLVPIYRECIRVSRGLVAFVVEGKTRNFQYSATPALLMADLHRSGIKLRKPPIFHRVGIPGSGGPDWLRNDWEWIVCASKGRLPWSENTAMGHKPKFAVGGEVSYRTEDGVRRNKKTGARLGAYRLPDKANPGNVIHCKVGGGKMGHPLAHENEAPFPLGLAKFFVASFCPEGGLVLDTFCGSGTALQAALELSRNCIGIDIRQSQVDLTNRRLGGLFA